MYHFIFALIWNISSLKTFYDDTCLQLGNSPVHRRAGSSGRRSSISACSFGTRSTRSTGSWARRSGGSGSNGGSSRVSGGGGFGSGVAAGSNTVVVQTIKSSGGGGVMEGGQCESDGSSTLNAACVVKNDC